MTAERPFPLDYGRHSRRRPLPVLASGPGRSAITLDGGDLSVSMGMSLYGRAPRSARTLSQTVVSRGVHGWPGDRLVDRAGDGLVELIIDPPMSGHVRMFPVHVRRLSVAVDGPGRLAGALLGDGRDG